MPNKPIKWKCNECICERTVVQTYKFEFCTSETNNSQAYRKIWGVQSFPEICKKKYMCVTIERLMENEVNSIKIGEWAIHSIDKFVAAICDHKNGQEVENAW